MDHHLRSSSHHLEPDIEHSRIALCLLDELERQLFATVLENAIPLIP
jgi:hypothetical protein